MYGMFTILVNIQYLHYSGRDRETLTGDSSTGQKARKRSGSGQFECSQAAAEVDTATTKLQDKGGSGGDTSQKVTSTRAKVSSHSRMMHLTHYKGNPSLLLTHSNFVVISFRTCD